MANLSNINNRFLVTTGGNVLIGNTAASGSSILQVTGDSDFTGSIAVTGTYSDSSGDVGTAGQILSSTATGTNWISHSTANDFLTGLSFNTGNGILTATVSNQSNVTVDLDGRYLTSYTETDTLQNVCSRGNSTSTAINMTGSGASGYLYVAGNAASAAPTNSQGMAFAYNNSGGSRENELFFNPGIVTPADNATYYFAIINEYLNASSGNVRTTDTLLKLYGDGNLELVGPTATSTIANTFWRMPKSAAPNTGYYLSKSAGSIDLQWTAPPSGGSGTVTGTGTAKNLTMWATGGTGIEDSPIKTQTVNTLNQIVVEDAERIIIDKPSSVTSGDPAFQVAQDGTAKTEFGWDDDGGGFAFVYNYSGNGIKLGAAGNNPMIEVVTTTGAESVNLHKQIEFKDYGSGTYTGTAAYNLSVDSSGNIIETSGGGGGLTPALVEQTWTFTRAELNAGFGGSGYTLIAAPGGGTTGPGATYVVIQESYWMTIGTATSNNSLQLEARQSNQIPGVQTVTRVNGTQWNYMTGNNSGNGMVYRPAVTGNAVVRPYLPGSGTTLHKVSGGTLPSGFTSLKLKLIYKLFTSANM